MQQCHFAYQHKPTDSLGQGEATCEPKATFLLLCYCLNYSSDLNTGPRQILRGQLTKSPHCPNKDTEDPQILNGRLRTSPLSFLLVSGIQGSFTRSIILRWNIRHKDKDSSAKVFSCFRTVQKPLHYFVIKILPDADIGGDLFICVVFIFNIRVCILYEAIFFLKNQIHIYFSIALKLKWSHHETGLLS